MIYVVKGDTVLKWESIIPTLFTGVTQFLCENCVLL